MASLEHFSELDEGARHLNELHKVLVTLVELVEPRILVVVPGGLLLILVVLASLVLPVLAVLVAAVATTATIGTLVLLIGLTDKVCVELCELDGKVLDHWRDSRRVVHLETFCVDAHPDNAINLGRRGDLSFGRRR